MLRVGVRAIRDVLGARTFASAPAEAAAVSLGFKVQDNKDFNDRVMNSKVPVIVDFFAT